MERRAVRPLAAFLRTTRCYEPRRRFTTPAVALAGPLDGWQLKLGLEVHAQIASATKLFSASSSAPDSAINVHVSAMDAALPGALPALNRACVTAAMRLGLALGGTVCRQSRFERKHYFYCDLPAGYQVTQQQWPIVRGGQIAVNRGSGKQSIRVHRIQLEQDSGKNVHDLHAALTHVDLNRAGVGLMEIVSEPDMATKHEAAEFVRALSAILQRLGVCRAQMEDGSLRVDVNVSVHHHQRGIDGERVEVKNINSIRHMLSAIQYEYDRQIGLINSGQGVERQTRTWDARTQMTHLLRAKDSLLDYRFMPDPDLPPLIISDEAIEETRRTIPELPEARLVRLQRDYNLSPYDAGVLSAEPGAVEYFERLVHGETENAVAIVRSPQVCVNWLTSELFGRLKKQKSRAIDTQAEDDGGTRVKLLNQCSVSSERLAALLDLMQAAQISGKHGKAVLDAMVDGDGRPPSAIAQSMGFALVNDDSLIATLADEVTAAHAAAIEAHHAKHNPRLAGFLTGQLLRAAKGKADPKRAAEAIHRRIDAR